jgi:hypothetical protein
MALTPEQVKEHMVKKEIENVKELEAYIDVLLIQSYKEGGSLTVDVLGFSENVVKQISNLFISKGWQLEFKTVLGNKYLIFYYPGFIFKHTKDET